MAGVRSARLASALALAALASRASRCDEARGETDDASFAATLLAASAPSLPASAAAARASSPPAPPALPAPSRAVPFVPRLLLAPGAPELAVPPDPLAFTENCLVRAAGAVVIGGVLGFGMGALFSGYGALAPYDPALRDWQLTQEHLKRQQALAAKGGAAGVAGAAGAAGAAGSIAGAAAPLVPRNALLETLAPVHLPELGAAMAAPARAAAAAAPLHLQLQGAGALPFPSEPPTQSLREAFVTGLREMRQRGWASAKSFGVLGGIYTTVECSLERLRGVKDLKSAVVSGFLTGAIIAVPAGPAAMAIGGGGFALFSGVIEVLSPLIFDH